MSKQLELVIYRNKDGGVQLGTKLEKEVITAILTNLICNGK